MNWEPGDGDEIESWKVLCPNRDNPDRDFLVWDSCGCTPPAGVEYPRSEWEAFIAGPCAHSPTGADVYNAEWGTIDCPRPESCWHADETDLDDAWEAVGWEPGSYAIDARFAEGGGADWTVIPDVASRTARRDAEHQAGTGR